MKRWLARMLTRDAIMFVGGWYVILYQMLEVPPQNVNEWFLLLGGAMIGVPGISEIIALRSGRGKLTDAPVSPAAPSASSSQLP